MSLTFVVGSAADVFAGELARAIEKELRAHFPGVGSGAPDAYESEPLNPRGWRSLQERVMRTLDAAPQLTTVDAYQAVFLPSPQDGIAQLPVATLADPLQVGNLHALLEELRAFASAASLPTDDVELMELAAQYLESEYDRDLDIQTYVQLMLSAKQAVARNEALWVVV